KPLAKQTLIKNIRGILNEQQNKITAISMQTFDDIAKNKEKRNDLIVSNLPLVKCNYSYHPITPTNKYANYINGNINYTVNHQDRGFDFPVRKLLTDTLEAYDRLPKIGSPEYDKI